MTSLIFAIGVTFFASTLQGIAGFGAGLISMGLLSMIWTIPQATSVMIPLGLLLNLSLIVQQRQYLSVSTLTWIFIGLPLGVFIGIYSLETLPDTQLKILLGLALLASVINTLAQGQRSITFGMVSQLITGVCAGVTGAALSSPGPPILILANLSGWQRDRFRANLSLLFGTCALLSLIGLLMREQVTFNTLSTSLALAPGVITGSVIGVKLGTHLPQRSFRRVVLVLLTLLAAKFLLDPLV